MGLRTAKILQAAFVLMFGWYVYSVIGGWHWLLAFLLLIVALANAVTVWMLRENRETLARLCQNQAVKRYVAGICYFTRQQVPLDERPGAAVDQLLLRSNRDFEVAVGRAKQIVRGHDQILDRILNLVSESIMLRRARRSSNSLGPLASFLLVGDDGIGKRYLARVVAKLLYRTGRVEVFDCERITLETLVGFKDRPGELLEVMRAEQFQLLVFERVDLATKEVASVIARLLSAGKLSQPGTASTVSFQQSVVVLTATPPETIAFLETESTDQTAWQQQLMEALRDEQRLDIGLLNAVGEVLFCEPPSDEVKAEVISLLMQKECGMHGIELTHADPIIVATQVLQIADESGFAHCPNRVRKLLSQPLVAATADEYDTLSLRIAKRAPESGLVSTNR